MIPHSWIHQAHERIAPYIVPTPLTFDRDHNWWIKWENRQATGSFKLRGALAKILGLLPWERAQGIVTASAGNHGQGVAFACQLTGTPVLVFTSESAVPVKIEAMRALGAEIQMVPGGYTDAEKAALGYAQEHQSVWVSPYNDGQVIAGQGTVALEVLAEMPEAAAMDWLVPTGGGGLLAGIASVLKSGQFSQEAPGYLTGVQSQASPFMHGLFHHGSQDGIIELPSLADGLAGAVEAGSVTIPIVRNYVDDIILVSEKEIGQAIQFAWRRYREQIEGSAAVSLAAALAQPPAKQPVLIIISGGNIQPEIHAELTSQ